MHGRSKGKAIKANAKSVSAKVILQPSPRKQVRINEVMNLIEDLERTFPVHRWTIGSLHVWPLIRLHLAHTFYDLHFLKGTVRAGTLRWMDLPHVTLKILRSVLGYIYAIVADHTKTQRADGGFDVLFLNYNSYMTLMDGTWYSRLCDPFIASLSSRGFSCLMLTAGYEYSFPRFTKSVFVQPRLTIQRIIGSLQRMKDENLQRLTEFERYVKESGLFAESFTVMSAVRRHGKQVMSLERYFAKLLLRTQPRVVFVACGYNTESMALILACRRAGIPTVDIQHGRQGDSHVAYGHWHRLPEEGYELLPTAYWCWSDVEAAVIDRWGKNLDVHRPVVGGNLFLQRWLSDTDDVVMAYDEILTGLKNERGQKVHILYSLNGCTTNELETMIEAIGGINSGDLKCHFWVRLHPVTIEQKGEVQTALVESGIKNCEVEHATTLPLYAILRHMDVHLTEFSSVVVEAEAFGVPSVLYKLGTRDFPSQVSSGWAVTAHTIDELSPAIHRQLALSAHHVSRRRGVAVPEREAFDRLFELVADYSERTDRNQAHKEPTGV